MDARQDAALCALHRSQQFLDSYPHELHHINHSPSRARLDEAIAGIEAAAERQRDCETRSQSLTRRIADHRSWLVGHHLEPLVIMMREDPALAPEAQTLKLPAQRVSDFQVVAFARAVLNWLPARRDRFVAEHFPHDFVEQLEAGVAEFTRLTEMRELCRLEQVRATVELAEAVTRAWSEVRKVKALIKANGATRPLVAQWRLAQLHAPRLKNPEAPPLVLSAVAPSPAPDASGLLPAAPSPAPEASVLLPAVAERPGLLRRIAAALVPGQAA